MMYFARSFLLLPLLLTFSLLAGCSGDESETAAPGPEQQETLGKAVDDAGDMQQTGEKQAADKTVGNPVASNPLDLSYITDDFTAAVIVHPSRVLNSDFMNSLVEAGVPLEEALQEPIDKIGIDPRNVEQIILLTDKATARAAPLMLPVPMRRQPGGLNQPQRRNFTPENPDQGSLTQPDAELQTVAFQLEDVIDDTDDTLQEPTPTLIVRFADAVNEEAFFKNLPGAPLESGEVDGLQVRRVTNPDAVLHFVNPQTLIVTRAALLKKMVETKSAESDLISELKTIDANHDLIVAADLAPLRPLLEQFGSLVSSIIPPDMSALAQIPGKSKMLTLTAGVSHDSLLSLSLVMDSEQDATAVNDALAEGLKQVRQQYEQLRPMLLDQNAPFSAEEREELMQIADEIVSGTSSGAAGNRLTVSIPKPGNFDRISAFLVPAIERARQAARRSEQRNKLKMIGIAFHNYHDFNKAFPAAGSDAGGEKKGLSWRVHLLPYLEQVPLYEKFNLDEPWDSEHNKALISQMPDVFASPNVSGEGKTVFHVIIGEQTAFQMEKGLKMRDFEDGLTKTILVVQAGPDKADVWTKPGGLEFNAENPVEAFGSVEDTIQLLLGDGSVHAISVFAVPELFKALITRNGAEPVGDF